MYFFSGKYILYKFTFNPLFSVQFRGIKYTEFIVLQAPPIFLQNFIVLLLFLLNKKSHYSLSRNFGNFYSTFCLYLSHIIRLIIFIVWRLFYWSLRILHFVTYYLILVCYNWMLFNCIYIYIYICLHVSVLIDMFQFINSTVNGLLKILSFYFCDKNNFYFHVCIIVFLHTFNFFGNVPKSERCTYILFRW